MEADASAEELDKMMITVGEIQSELEHSGFYSLDAKIEEVANKVKGFSRFIVYPFRMILCKTT